MEKPQPDRGSGCVVVETHVLKSPHHPQGVEDNILVPPPAVGGNEAAPGQRTIPSPRDQSSRRHIPKREKGSAKMIKRIKELIRSFFSKEMDNSDKLGHDPFAGHCDASAGKSYFDDALAEYVGWQPGEPCNADADGEPCDIDFVTIGCDKKPGVQIWTLRLVPTLMVGGARGRGVTRTTNMEDVRKGVKCGYEVKTAPTPAPIYVRKVHGCLQLCSVDVKTNSEPTEYITVVITDEPNVGWTVASVHPGNAGGDIGKYLEHAVHYRCKGDPSPVKGYGEGEEFDPDLLVGATPDWVFEHLVKDPV